MNVRSEIPKRKVERFPGIIFIDICLINRKNIILVYKNSIVNLSIIMCAYRKGNKIVLFVLMIIYLDLICVTY